jgi:hypothetical protein
MQKFSRLNFFEASNIHINLANKSPPALAEASKAREARFCYPSIPDLGWLQDILRTRALMSFSEDLPISARCSIRNFLDVRGRKLIAFGHGVGPTPDPGFVKRKLVLEANRRVSNMGFPYNLCQGSTACASLGVVFARMMEATHVLDTQS